MVTTNWQELSTREKRDHVLNTIQTFGELTLTFTKKDGTEVTRNTFYKTYEKVTSRVQPEDVIVYWDVSADGWRSFSVDNLISIRVVA